MKIFDYLFYAICKVYLNTRDSSPEFAAVCICSLIQSAVIFIAVEIRIIIINDKSGLNSVIGLLISLVFVVYNYMRYIYLGKHDYTKIKNLWESQSENKRTAYRILIIVFTTVTIISVIGLTIYVGNMK